MLIHANPAGFQAPPLIEGCGLCFEGAGKMWEGTRTVGETRDEGDPSGALRRVSNDNNFRDFYFTTSELIFCNYRCFRKPSKHIFSMPTSPLHPNNHPSQRNMSFRRPHPSSPTTTATTPAPYAIPSKLRPCDWSSAPVPTPLALNKLAGVCVILGVYTLGRCELVGGSQMCERRS